MKEKLTGWDAVRLFGPRVSLAWLAAFLPLGLHTDPTPPTPTPEPSKESRLVVINKSGNDVFIRLEKLDDGLLYPYPSFYYLTTPVGSKEEPQVKAFGIKNGFYRKDIWACGDKYQEGFLLVDGNVRMTFPPCNTFPKQGYGPRPSRR